MQPAYASPVNMSGVPRAIRRHAPLWGEHNGYVVSELLGRTPAEVERLAETGALR
jgi:crotonobetainyl-CoA:carnitine CoA-transferase CaiB-like acyl-CoA transferase